MSQKSPLLFLSIVLGILLFAPWEARGMLRYKGIASEVEGKGEGKNSYRQNDRGQIIDHETAESQSVKRGSLDNERGINTGVSEDIPEEEQERESLPLISFQMALAGHLYAERFFLTKTEYGNVELMAEEVASLEKSAQEISNENREVTRIFQAALEASAPGINFSDFFQTESMSSLESYPALSAEKIKQALTVYLKSNQNPLARIFHPSLLRKPGTPMAAALELNFDQDSMDSYSPDKNSSSGLPHQPSRLSRRESDEISGLAFLTGDFSEEKRSSRKTALANVEEPPFKYSRLMEKGEAAAFASAALEKSASSSQEKSPTDRQTHSNLKSLTEAATNEKMPKATLSKSEEAELLHQITAWADVTCRLKNQVTALGLEKVKEINNEVQLKEIKCLDKAAEATSFVMQYLKNVLEARKTGKTKEGTAWYKAAESGKQGYESYTKAASNLRLQKEETGKIPNERETECWVCVGGAAVQRGGYLAKSIELRQIGRKKEAGMWSEVAMRLEKLCQSKMKAALAWQDWKSGNEKKEREAICWNEAGKAVFYDAEHYKKYIELLISKKKEEAVMWYQLARCRNEQYINYVEAALSWETWAKGNWKNKEAAINWSQAGLGAKLAAWELNFSIKAKERKEECNMWNQLAKEDQSASEHWMLSAKAYEAGNKDEATQQDQEGWATAQSSCNLLLTYCQRQKEKAEKANNQDDALAWSEAVQLSKITIDCMNSAVTQQEFWNASQSWQEVIISSKFATHALIQSIATKDQESSDWKKMSHGYEETSKLGINAALAYQAGRKEEGQRFDQEARKTWVKILDLSKY